MFRSSWLAKHVVVLTRPSLAPEFLRALWRIYE
jgi:hypothetical protein